MKYKIIDFTVRPNVCGPSIYTFNVCGPSIYTFTYIKGIHIFKVKDGFRIILLHGEAVGKAVESLWGLGEGF